jgi:hypothetical protein
MWFWLQAQINQKTGNFIDLKHRNIIQIERGLEKNVFECIFTAVLYLAAHNLAFRGSSGILCTTHNGILV